MTANQKQWFDRMKTEARSIPLDKKRGIMEVEVFFDNELSLQKRDILTWAKDSTIKTFGWPIAVFLDRSEFKPQPDRDGHVARVFDKSRGSLDFWAWNAIGAFYLYKTIFEDERKENAVFFDTRIIRVTETLMYLRNFFRLAKIAGDTTVSITVRHHQLQGRRLMSANSSRMLFWEYLCVREKTSETVLTTNIDKLNNDEEIFLLARNVTDELFRLFNFELSEAVFRDIATNYLNGKVV
ncbi:MAG: hypothetical protein WC813_03400 [Patescibacteria group bacterium]|jgi:hypothetical protein